MQVIFPMKRLLFAVALFSILLLGCTQSAPAPSSTPTATPMPSVTVEPSPTPEATPASADAAESIVAKAQAQVPLSPDFVTELTGLPVTAPSEYNLTTEGNFTTEADLAPLHTLSFATSPRFIELMKKMTLTTRYSRNFEIKSDPRRLNFLFRSLDVENNTVMVLYVQLIPGGENLACITDFSESKLPNCEVLDATQANAFWDALTSNALTAYFKDTFPGTSPALFLKATRIDGNHEGRDAVVYHVTPNEAGAALLGGVPLEMYLFIDAKYGFPLTLYVLSKDFKGAERMTAFKYND